MAQCLMGEDFIERAADYKVLFDLGMTFLSDSPASLELAACQQLMPKIIRNKICLTE
jgi:hypothetical protein